MRKMIFKLAVVAVMSLGLCAFGSPILINNTGLGALNAGDQDTNWTIIVPSAGNTYEVYGSPNIQAPFPWWPANNATSQWIGPQARYNQGDNDVQGTWTFRTTFNLSGLDPATAVITGRWMTDNQGTNIYINSASTGQTTPLNAFQTDTWTSFTISGGFLPTLNTLDFQVLNQDTLSGGPVGLRVEFLSATADPSPVPEPTTFALLGAGLVALGLVRRRKLNA
jgi:hypothetical protein